MEKIRIKEWFLDKEQSKASGFNMWFTAPERGGKFNQPIRTDGYQAILIERLGESEKAVKVRIDTGEVQGSCKGWVTWIPKSIIFSENSL